MNQTSINHIKKFKKHITEFHHGHVGDALDQLHACQGQRRPLSGRLSETKIFLDFAVEMIRNFWNFHRKTESSAQIRNLGQQFWQWKVPSLLVARQTWEIRWIFQIFPIIPLDRRIFQHWNECLEDHWDGYCEWFSVVASAWVSGRFFSAHGFGWATWMSHCLHT